MNRLSWIFIGGTAIIIIGISVFFLRPLCLNAWKTYQETKQTIKDNSEVAQRKDILKELQKNTQLDSVYTIASKYIPQTQNSGELIIELSAIANQSNMKVEQVSLDDKKVVTKKEEDTETKTTQKTETVTTPSGIQEIKFSMKLSGTFADFTKFIKNTESSSRLISINTMMLSSTTDSFTAQLSGKTYYKQSSDLKKTLENIKLTSSVIEKFQNLKTFGTPINLPTESGFGRDNPFSSTK